MSRAHALVWSKAAWATTLLSISLFAAAHATSAGAAAHGRVSARFYEATEDDAVKLEALISRALHERGAAAGPIWRLEHRVEHRNIARLANGQTLSKGAELIESAADAAAHGISVESDPVLARAMRLLQKGRSVLTKEH